jgi:hypothetical protein
MRRAAPGVVRRNRTGLRVVRTLAGKPVDDEPLVAFPEGRESWRNTAARHG